MLSIIALYAVKAILTETLLARQMPLPLGRDHLMEAVLTAAFILCNWLLGPCAAVGVYLGAYLLYLAAKRKSLLASVRTLRALMAEKEAEA